MIQSVKQNTVNSLISESLSKIQTYTMYQIVPLFPPIM